MKTSEIFKREIGFIKSPILKEVATKVLDKSPEIIQIIPASSTKKYHPKADIVVGNYNENGEIEKTGGLVNHIVSVVGIAKSLFESNVFKDMIKSDYDYMMMLMQQSISENTLIEMYEDCAIVATLLHDCCKCDNTPEHHTLHNHPVLAAELFKEVLNEVSKESLIPLWEYGFYNRVIYNGIASHMGKWTTSKYMPDITLPNPETGFDNFVHMCDYIASRKFIDFNFNRYDNRYDEV